MIRIFKNNQTMTVTKGAYESFFKPLGYQVVIEAKEKSVKVDKPKPEKSKNEGTKIALPKDNDKKEVE